MLPNLSACERELQSEEKIGGVIGDVLSLVIGECNTGKFASSFAYLVYFPSNVRKKDVKKTCSPERVLNVWLETEVAARVDELQNEDPEGLRKIRP